MSEIVFFTFFSGLFLGAYVFLHTPYCKRLLHLGGVFRLFLICIFVLQILAIGMIRFQVGDVMLFSDAGYYFRNGVDYYWIDSNHDKYPFFPLLIFFHAVANKLTYLLPVVNFVQILKLLLLVSLYAIAKYIYTYSKLGLVERRSQVLGLLVNPITYAVILFHGQIDVILIAFFIIASHTILTSRSFAGLIFGGLLYAASVATKTWSVIFLPIYLAFFGFKKTLVVGLVTAAFLFVDIFIYTRMVFGSGFMVVLPAILRPGGPVGIWGISYIFGKWAEFLAQYNLYIFGLLLSLGLLFILFKKIPFWEAATLLILWVLLIIPNWGVQYLFWVIPFSYLLPRGVKWVGFDLLAGIYIYLNYINVLSSGYIPTWIVLHLGLLLWLVIGVMFVKGLLHVRRT